MFLGIVIAFFVSALRYTVEWKPTPDIRPDWYFPFIPSGLMVLAYVLGYLSHNKES